MIPRPQALRKGDHVVRVKNFITFLCSWGNFVLSWIMGDALLLDPSTGDNKDILELLLQVARNNHVTDIHIPFSGVCYMRRSNVLEPVINADTGEPFELFDTDFTKILGAFKFERHTSISRRLAFRDIQLRALYLSVNHHKGSFDELLILRVQPVSPPSLESFILSDEVREALTSPHGLIMVTGMIGSGKTSLASSICSHWMDAGKHIFTVEDPIEYFLKSGKGRVTQLSANLLSTDSIFESAAMVALRADIDGLFIGECRNAQTFRVCLDAATTHEPCITTLHSGGFADALTRAMSFAQNTMPKSMAEFSLSQALHSILHISLAYTPSGRPIPMVSVLPFWSSDNVKKLLINMTPVEMLDQIRNIMREADLPGVVSYDAAARHALSQGATEESVRAARAYSPEVPSYLQN